jgi:competence protein ComFC
MGVKSVWRELLNVFFPRTCGVCRADVPAQDEFALCADCRAAVPRWEGLLCALCGAPLPDGGARCFACRTGPRGFQLCRSLGLYEGVLKTALRRLKYEGKDYLAAPLGALLAEDWAGRPDYTRVERVVPVPLHFWRRRARGYNQAELLARSFCGWTGLPLDAGALGRRRATKSQTDLDRDARRENVRDAFEVRRAEGVAGKNILLIDDVCTTGATLDACARALRRAGAKRVLAMTVARQV